MPSSSLCLRNLSSSFQPCCRSQTEYVQRFITRSELDSCSLSGGNFVLEWKKGPFFWRHLGLIVVNCGQVTVFHCLSSFSRNMNERQSHDIDCDVGWTGRSRDTLQSTSPRPQQTDWCAKESRGKGGSKGAWWLKRSRLTGCKTC